MHWFYGLADVYEIQKLTIIGIRYDAVVSDLFNHLKIPYIFYAGKIDYI